MAPQTKQRLSTVDEAASGSEDDLTTAHASSTAARAPAKGKAAPAKRTAAKTNGQATNKRKAPAAAAKEGRAALKDKTNIQETDREDELEDEIEPAKAKRAKTTATTTAATARKKKAAATKKPANQQQFGVIPETQPDAEEVSQSIEMDQDALHAPTAPNSDAIAQRAYPVSAQPLVPRPSARSASVQPLLPRPSARSLSVQPGYPMHRERSGSVSDTTRARRGGDLEMRRKLNDITKKYEDLSVKYQSLQHIVEEEGESNFEKLQRATEQKSKDADNLIASLKKEIAELRKLSAPVAKDNSGEIKELQKQVSGLTSKNTALSAECDETKKALQTAQNEAKSLEVKLTSARHQLSASAAQEAKEKEQHGRTVASNAPEGLKELKMKENLYSDLTGLIVRSVKRKDGEDEYDCIQTGRNGTLHFHLSVANDSAHINPQTPSGLSWEDAEFAYDPFLDERRDHALLDLLPEYLTDGICFPRTDAVKFYSKVLESMTKKIVVEDS